MRVFMYTLCFVVSVCVAPASAAQYVHSYVSKGPVSAGPNPSLDEVWMRHGGARLQYDALSGSIQTNTNGRPLRDPAAIRTLPPLYPTKRTPKRSKKTSVAKKPAPPKSAVVPKPSAKPSATPPNPPPAKEATMGVQGPYTAPVDPMPTSGASVTPMPTQQGTNTATFTSGAVNITGSATP